MNRHPVDVWSCSNARGGYLIFGVTDAPRVAIGLTGASRTSFDNLDQVKLTEGLDDIFSPEIHWELGLIEVSGVTLGLIYAFESQDKPVVAKKSYQRENANLLEGDIVYRYNSRTERAKFPELRRILYDAKLKEQRAMMLHVQELIKAGASNAAVLDFTGSTLQGPSGQKVLIDEGLLGKISFIREGEFDEVRGAPTLKVVGQVVPSKTIATGPERVIREALTTEDLLTDFLDGAQIGSPEQYIRQATAGTTSFLPIHYYRAAANMTHEQLVELVAGVTTRSQAKKKLLDRLVARDPMKLPAPSNSTQHGSTVVRRVFYDKLVAGDLPAFDPADASAVQRFLEAIKSLNDDQIREIFQPLIERMKDCFERHYGTHAGVADNLRRASCRVDLAMFAVDRAPDRARR